MIASIFGCLLALLLLHQQLPAEQLRFDFASDWQQWQLPLRARRRCANWLGTTWGDENRVIVEEFSSPLSSCFCSVVSYAKALFGLACPHRLLYLGAFPSSTYI